jgi:multidrug resistance efflux pump
MLSLSENINSTYQFRKSNQLYFVILLFIFGSIAALPFVKTTVSISSAGITRPAQERTDIKPVVSGIIDSLYAGEGDTVLQGALIATIRDPSNGFKRILNEFEIKHRFEWINDLKKLTSAAELKHLSLNTALYRQQLHRFLYQLADQQAALKKVNHELEINHGLLKDQVIAPKEQFDKEVEWERMTAAFHAFKNEQLIRWQSDLQQYETELSQFTAQKGQIETDRQNHYVYAPVGGILQQINTRYCGGYIAAGESLCMISPQSELIAECYVSTRDVGLLKHGQPARFQIDAFDYNYFGILTGKIISIDNDFTMMGNNPVFKVRCSFDSSQLHLRNGFKGTLKKGLSFQTRFVVAERTLWQLVFDNINDWLNPTAIAIATSTNPIAFW